MVQQGFGKNKHGLTPLALAEIAQKRHVRDDEDPDLQQRRSDLITTRLRALDEHAQRIVQEELDANRVRIDVGAMSKAFLIFCVSLISCYTYCGPVLPIVDGPCNITYRGNSMRFTNSAQKQADVDTNHNRRCIRVLRMRSIVS